MRKIIGLLMVLGMAITLALPVGTASAETYTGCSTKVETWARNAWYTDFIIATPVDMKVRLVANTIYKFCYNGDRTNTVKPLKANYCWTFISDRLFTADEFQGVSFNGYYWDDNEDTNPPTFVVGDDGSVQNCGVQDLDSPVLEMSQSPAWSMTAFIKVRLQPDTEAVFKVDGHSYRYFHPGDDLTIS